MEFFSPCPHLEGLFNVKAPTRAFPERSNPWGRVEEGGVAPALPITVVAVVFRARGLGGEEDFQVCLGHVLLHFVGIFGRPPEPLLG